jgi:hypothetical protein
LPTPVSSDLAPVDFYLFPNLKKELAGLTITPDEFKKDWGRILRETTKEELASATRSVCTSAAAMSKNLTK